MESFAEIKRTMFSDCVGSADLPQRCLMIIDDDLDITEALTSLLRNHYRLIPCLSSEEAMQRLSPEVNVVLLDIKMAVKDGLGVFNLLKTERPDLKIIFHSAYPGSSEKGVAVDELNHNGYLTKGEYQLPELLATVKAAMDPTAMLSDSSKEFKILNNEGEI
jgi:CheY-like chemotaxis protein